MKSFRKMLKIYRLAKPVFKGYRALFLFYLILKVFFTVWIVLLPILIYEIWDRKIINHGMGYLIIVLIFVLFYQGKGIVEKRVITARKVINRKLEHQMAIRTLDISYEKIEDPTFLDLKSGAFFTVSRYRSIDTLMEATTELCCQGIQLIIGSLFLLLRQPFLFLLISLPFIGQTLLNRSLNKKLNTYFKGLFSINRRFDYLNALKLDRGPQKDIRNFQMKEMILRKMKFYNDQTEDTFSKMNQLTFQTDALVKMIATGILYLAIGWIGLEVIRKSLSFVQFLVLFELLRQVQHVFSGIGDQWTLVHQLAGYLDAVIQMLSVSKKVEGTKEIGKIKSICFDNVSFHYPNAKKEILKNLSFSIVRGERFGIVGLNGSGKTTLMKLITGFYEPTKGEIRINGISLEEISKESLRKEIRAVFQDFMIFKGSIEENISTMEDFNIKRADIAVQKAGFQTVLQKLKNGYLTKVGSDLYDEGIELSGGERQRLAMARALYKNASLTILDEPSASLDPQAEFDFYQRMNKLSSHDEITLYVSHRMITTRFCDRILVLDGEHNIIDTPKNLLKDKNSLYTRLYQEQADIVRE